MLRADALHGEPGGANPEGRDSRHAADRCCQRTDVAARTSPALPARSWCHARCVGQSPFQGTCVKACCVRQTHMLASPHAEFRWVPRVCHACMCPLQCPPLALPKAIGTADLVMRTCPGTLAAITGHIRKGADADTSSAATEQSGLASGEQLSCLHHPASVPFCCRRIWHWGMILVCSRVASCRC